MPNGAGTQTTTTVQVIKPIASNSWNTVALDHGELSIRVFVGGAVFGTEGAEHILYFGGVDVDGRPVAGLGVITLSGEVPWTGGTMVGIVSGTVGFLLLVRRIAHTLPVAYMYPPPARPSLSAQQVVLHY